MRLAVVVAIIVGSLLPALLAQQPTVDRLYTPDSAVRFAAADAMTLHPDEAIYTRYLSLYNIPPDKRKAVGQTISFVCNSLSTRGKMYIPVFVGGTDNTLVRLNIDNYEWNKQAWEDLGRLGSGPKPQSEPYFHALIEQLGASRTVTKKKRVETTDQYGRRYFREVDEVVDAGSAKSKSLVGAPWIDLGATSALIRATGSEFPVLRADWFIVNATLPPAYYNFLRVGKKSADFEKLVFTDLKLAERARKQFKGIVVTSIVARNNRTLLRSPTFTNGYYWVSHDSLTSVDDRQYVQNILREKFDATEDIGTLPNGLQAYFLSDGKNNRLDFANPDIAIDNTAHDRLVRTGRSCMVCHAEGIKHINDQIRTLTKKLQDRDAVKLLITDKNDAYRIDELFGSDLDKQIIKDQNIFAEAVALATGLSSQDNGNQYAGIYNTYAEYLLTKQDIVREVGLPPDLLERYIRLSTDNVILGLMGNPVSPVRRDQWERSFQSLMIIAMAAQQGMVPIQPQPPFNVLKK